jgi:hypothetical protein
LGFSTDCNDLTLHDLKPVDFEVDNKPDGRTSDQYFIVCVPQTTDADVESRARSLDDGFAPASGPLVPRLLGCPDEMVFNQDNKMCEN